MADGYVPFCSGAALAPAKGPSTELVLREWICNGPADGPELEHMLLNFELARAARLRAEERARDDRHSGRWRTPALHWERDAHRGLTRGLEVDVGDAAIAARQSSRELAIRGVPLDEVLSVQARAAGAMQNAATVGANSALVQTAVACAVSSVRRALSSPSGSQGTTALEQHVAEVVAASERPIADLIAVLRLKIWDMRLRMFFFVSRTGCAARLWRDSGTATPRSSMSRTGARSSSPRPSSTPR